MSAGPLVRTSVEQGVQTEGYVGNDVVDLDDPAIAADRVRPRFVRRVCDASEVARVEAVADPATLLWSLFAAKEAAFKAMVKRRPGLVFAHRLFAVAEDLRSVRYERATLRLWVDRGPGWVHAVAVANTRKDSACPPWRVELLRDGEGASLGVRRLLCEYLAPRLGCAPTALGVVRAEQPGSWSGFGPPRLLRDGAETDVDISLSHDGRFIAAAALVPAIR